MIQIIAGGKPHKGWLADGISEYERRLSRQYGLKWTFVPEDKLNRTLLNWPFKGSYYVIFLDEHGENLTSLEFADKIERVWNTSLNLVFVIGGAYGFPPQVLPEANFVWSLGKQVFPHEITRLLVAEQIYRAQEIRKKSGYHHF